jgi:amino-acid N-acetyltransferase
MTDAFVPGSFWSAERIEAARSRARAKLASPEFQAMMSMAEPPEFPTPDGGVPDFRAPISRDRCTVRRGRPADIARMTELIAGANLPPLFIEEFIDGFATVEYEDAVIGCGGLEIYGGSGVIRSVVIDERARGLGLGRDVADLLIADARAAGATDLYLFTMDAHAFWTALGFRDLPLEAWREDARENWQYQFMSTHPEMLEAGVHSMWMHAQHR